jgi:hypothetical protein
MLFKVSADNGKFELEDATPIRFAALPKEGPRSATEADLESLIAQNVGLVEATSADDEEETMLILARQARTTTGKRMDLVAVDNTGALILIEVKRDAEDVQYRWDHAEIQAVRYAASLAKLRTVDDLVVTLYANYIQRYQEEDLKRNAGDRTAAEWARKKLQDFIDDNNIRPERLNHTQKIVLIGASLDDDTKSAAAWMAANGIPIRVIEIQPTQIGEQCFLDVQQVIPPPTFESFYVDVSSSGRDAGSSSGSGGKRKITRRYRPRVPALIQAGRINAGDEIWVWERPQHKATLTADGKCTHDGKTDSLYSWACEVTGWNSVNIYEWVVHGPTGLTLEKIREELERTPDSATPNTAPEPSTPQHALP